jgi:hypothetical protein
MRIRTSCPPMKGPAAACRCRGVAGWARSGREAACAHSQVPPSAGWDDRPRNSSSHTRTASTISPGDDATPTVSSPPPRPTVVSTVVTRPRNPSVPPSDHTRRISVALRSLSKVTVHPDSHVALSTRPYAHVTERHLPGDPILPVTICERIRPMGGNRPCAVRDARAHSFLIAVDSGTRVEARQRDAPADLRRHRHRHHGDQRHRPGPLPAQAVGSAGRTAVPRHRRHARRLAWHVFDPAVMYWAPQQVQSLWGATSIFTTEIGCRASDVVAGDGSTTRTG